MENQGLDITAAGNPQAWPFVLGAEVDVVNQEMTTQMGVAFVVPITATTSCSRLHNGDVDGRDTDLNAHSLEDACIWRMPREEMSEVIARFTGRNATHHKWLRSQLSHLRYITPFLAIRTNPNMPETDVVASYNMGMKIVGWRTGDGGVIGRKVEERQEKAR